VTNTGNVELDDVLVVDDQGVTLACTPDAPATLAIGAVMTCTATDTATAGQYTNLNGVDADTGTGPYIPIGDPVNWEYVVTNLGNTLLTGVLVADDDAAVTPDCLGQTTLAAHATMTCTASGTATAGQYSNLGLVAADSTGNGIVADNDPSHYFGVDSSIDIETRSSRSVTRSTGNTS